MHPMTDRLSSSDCVAIHNEDWGVQVASESGRSSQAQRSSPLIAVFLVLFAGRDTDNHL